MLGRGGGHHDGPVRQAPELRQGALTCPSCFPTGEMAIADSMQPLLLALPPLHLLGDKPQESYSRKPQGALFWGLREEGAVRALETRIVFKNIASKYFIVTGLSSQVPISGNGGKHHLTNSR